MPTAEKTAAVAELTDAFRDAAGAVLTEYRGLTVGQLATLRRSLGDDARYAVVKNTLTKIAARQAGVAGLDDHLNGPTAIAFISGDPVVVAKQIRDFARANPLLVVKAGLLEGRAISADEVRRLADLESREVLLGRLAGALQASLTNAVRLFAAPLSQVARLAAALQEARGGAEGAADAGAPADDTTVGAGAAEAAAGAPRADEDGSADTADSDDRSAAEQAGAEDQGDAELSAAEQGAAEQGAADQAGAADQSAPDAPAQG